MTFPEQYIWYLNKSFILNSQDYKSFIEDIEQIIGINISKGEYSIYTNYNIYNTTDIEDAPISLAIIKEMYTNYNPIRGWRYSFVIK